ncbi:Tfp pilus assembly protein PilN [Desulfohalotomaculum tongense]|uniref:PilN domain-containing protein n=1 Tax=Desulforadius tongensis TaxID=1216062 RepID=UPI0019590698|nr:PilN domain-containing protein [Desulforadius tongensis]MBM7854509.1 Tfp pilus assembly protein PilN [Desulforadius tongensis]
MRYKINLLPKELQPKPLIDFAKLAPLICTALLICAITGGYLTFIFKLQAKKETLNALQAELASAAPVVNMLNDTRSQKAKNKQKIDQLQDLLQENINWYTLLEDINYNIPQDTWLNQIKYTEIEIETKKKNKVPLQEQQDLNIEELIEYQSDPEKNRPGEHDKTVMCKKALIIKGSSASLSSTGMFIYKLQQLPYFEDVILKNAWKVKKEQPVISFTINAIFPEGEGNE